MKPKKTSSKAASEAVAVNRRRLLNNESPFAIKEAYVKLRTSLMFCMTADKERACKTFAITSSKPSEGKSLTAANVAISYAMLGKKVLLIDADMRKPTQRKLWKVELAAGLCDFLAKIWKLEINGVPKSGWWNLTDENGEEGYYYFDPVSFKGLNGKTQRFFANLTYEFENGKLIHGAWLKTDYGTRYYFGPTYVYHKWFTVDGNLYYFAQDGYRYEGLRYVKEVNNHDDPGYWYNFGGDGICQGVYQHTGLFELNGNTYYTINGMVCNGLYKAEDGYYYYFASNYAAVKNGRYWVSYPNDTGFAEAFYDFDEYGHLKLQTNPDYNGIVEIDGVLYYYVDGIPTYAGLIQIDGDYYYVNSSFKVVTTLHYWVNRTNGLLPAGFYDFGPDGKMIKEPTPDPDPKPDPEPDPEKKNGIVNWGCIFVGCCHGYPCSWGIYNPLLDENVFPCPPLEALTALAVVLIVCRYEKKQDYKPNGLAWWSPDMG